MTDVAFDQTNDVGRDRIVGTGARFAGSSGILVADLNGQERPIHGALQSTGSSSLFQIRTVRSITVACERHGASRR